MTVADFMLLANEGVSLAVLIVVLIGVYKLTNRVIEILLVHVVRCCESLDRIADAIERSTTE